MTAPEFSRMVDVRQAQGKTLRLTAGEAERAALARRFGLVAIDRLEADVALEREGREVNATGRLIADLVQSCAVSGEELPVALDEPIVLRFVPAKAANGTLEEIEVGAEECDEIEYSGDSFDLGEAVAQSLALAIDPFAAGPDADEARREAGLAGGGEAGPFAALADFKSRFGERAP